MEITKPMVEQILKTLPVSYYCKKPITVELTDNESSFNPISDTIRVGYNLVASAMKTLTNDTKLEQNVRTLLYHEISHAILTPKTLHSTKYVNIVEDERIETILANFYHNVDFKDFVIKANNYQGQKPKDFDDFFYQIVRFRVGPQELLSDLNELIRRYSQLTSLSTYTWWYFSVINDFVEKVKEYWTNMNTQQSVQNNTSEQSDEKLKQSQITQQTDEQLVKQSNQMINDIIENAKDEQAIIQISNEAASNIITGITSYYQSTDVQNALDKLLNSRKVITKQNASAINTYSGIFNPRSVVRDDYKYFVQQNRVGHIKMFAKTKLNLFIDCSGSFQHNDDKVNELLYSLTKIEKSNPDFEYDLIHCEEGEQLAEKNKRFQKSNGGTYMTDEIIAIYKKVQNPLANNLNIVLYDGYMFESGHKPTVDELKHKFATFNNNKTILILDKHNEFVKNYITNARLIITNNYVNELLTNVLRALQILL